MERKGFGEMRSITITTRYWQIATAALTLLSAPAARGGALPPDVRADHWAAGAVEQIVRAGVLTVMPDKQFHGSAHVTRAEAVIAIAAVARKLDAGTWPAGASKPVPDKVSKTLEGTAWQNAEVTRFELATALVRFGNYYAKAIPKPAPGTKDLAKSEVVPSGVKIPAAIAAHPREPVFSALKYLTDGRMIKADSPLLSAGAQIVKASELSRGIAEMAAGLTDKMTALNHDELGDTPDKSFRPKKPRPQFGSSSR